MKCHVTASHASNGRKSKDEAISSIGFVNTLDTGGFCYQTVSKVYFIIGVSRADLWSQGSLSMEQGCESYLN